MWKNYRDTLRREKTLLIIIGIVLILLMSPSCEIKFKVISVPSEESNE